MLSDERSPKLAGRRSTRFHKVMDRGLHQVPPESNSRNVAMEWQHQDYRLTDQPRSDSIEASYALLQTTYWSHRRSREVIAKVFEHSLCFFLYHDDRQIGFARAISDYATTSWIADVVLDEAHRNNKLGTWFMQKLLEHPQLDETQFVLQTRDAHPFYERLGFSRSDAMMSTSVDYLQDFD